MELNQKIYNCRKKIIYPPTKFITYNYQKDKYKTEVLVDECLADEIEHLWDKGIKTTGCCCGHGYLLGFIEVTEDCIKSMEQLGYIHYIYDVKYGGNERKDAFIPKSYGHIYDGYTNSFQG